MAEIHLCHGDGWGGDGLEVVVVQMDGADGAEPREHASPDINQLVEGQVHVQETRQLPEGAAPQLGQVVVVHVHVSGNGEGTLLPLCFIFFFKRHLLLSARVNCLC